MIKSEPKESDKCIFSRDDSPDTLAATSEGPTTHPTSIPSQSAIHGQDLIAQLIEHATAPAQGEEVHHEAQDQEAHADDVDWQSPDAKAPRAWKQRLPDKTLPYDAADRNDVGTGKRTSAERCDDVESDLTAQIDQR